LINICKVVSSTHVVYNNIESYEQKIFMRIKNNYFLFFKRRFRGALNPTFMTPIKKALILSLGLHLVGIFGGGIFFKKIRLKDKKIIYPIHLIEIAESSPKPVIKPLSKKEKVPQPQKKKVVQKEPEKKKQEPKKGIPLKKKVPEKIVDKPPDTPKAEKTDTQKEEDKQKVSQAIEEIRKSLAQKEKSPAQEISKAFIERQLQIYAAYIDRKIKENWSIPKAFLSEMGDLEAIVVLRLHPNGELAEARLEKPSGFHPFDESTLRAIKKASPFPAPPIEFTEEELEFEIRFYSNQIG